MTRPTGNRPLLLGFTDYREPARRLAERAGLEYEEVRIHRFPDGEVRVSLPEPLPDEVIFCRSLDHPNEKLVELMLAAGGARELGVTRITLVAPYLCYMRQDKAFSPGEVVSQRIIGNLLGALFDRVITVDAHLHRVQSLEEVIPIAEAVNLNATAPMASFLAQKPGSPLLIGPDMESEQWVNAIAEFDHLQSLVASKQRLGDAEVKIDLPDMDIAGRDVVLVDDVISSGGTLITVSGLLRERGVASISVLVTHALFAGNALQKLQDAGIANIWSCDAIVHSTNAIHLADELSRAIIANR